MDPRTAVDLLRSAIHTRGGTWADFGAGHGVFTRALAELLGDGSRLYAVERDAHALAAIDRWAAASTHDVVTVAADFTRRVNLPDLDGEQLDGILFANSLHFVRDADAVLGRLVEAVKRGGQVVLVEYDRRSASRWVPYPVSPVSLPSLAAAAGLSPFELTATMPSAFEGQLYAAAATKR